MNSPPTTFWAQRLYFSKIIVFQPFALSQLPFGRGPSS